MGADQPVAQTPLSDQELLRLLKRAADDLDRRIHDPLGARDDLEAGVLRTPADPKRTFTDDPLRMLRGIRFAAELGFQLAPELVPAMRELRGRLSPPVISAERVAAELRKMLESARPRLALELLDESGLLEVVLPEFAAWPGTRARCWTASWPWLGPISPPRPTPNPKSWTSCRPGSTRSAQSDRRGSLPWFLGRTSWPSGTSVPAPRSGGSSKGSKSWCSMVKSHQTGKQ